MKETVINAHKERIEYQNNRQIKGRNVYARYKIDKMELLVDVDDKTPKSTGSKRLYGPKHVDAFDWSSNYSCFLYILPDQAHLGS